MIASVEVKLVREDVCHSETIFFDGFKKKATLTSVGLKR